MTISEINTTILNNYLQNFDHFGVRKSQLDSATVKQHYVNVNPQETALKIFFHVYSFDLPNIITEVARLKKDKLRKTMFIAFPISINLSEN